VDTKKRIREDRSDEKGEMAEKRGERMVRSLEMARAQQKCNDQVTGPWQGGKTETKDGQEGGSSRLEKPGTGQQREGVGSG